MISELGWSKVGMLSCPSTCSRCHGCCWRKWSRDTMTGRSTALFTSGGTSTVTDIRQNSCCVSVVLLAVSAPKPSEKLSEHTLKQWRHDFVRPVGRDAVAQTWRFRWVSSTTKCFSTSQRTLWTASSISWLISASSFSRICNNSSINQEQEPVKSAAINVHLD